MPRRNRCDDIIRLIDEALGTSDADVSVASEPATEARTRRAASGKLRPAAG
ncbi:MAG TPA: hypothetical protein VFH45_05525 [Acidimicrobiales bacterium]|nr:hypothetical protein [Acidimicrobiales bacterium]